MVVSCESSLVLAIMGDYQLPHWLQAVVAASDGLGLFLLALTDSLFLPLPTVNDLVLIDLCFTSPLRMPYYAGMATLGSLSGSLILYFLGRKGGEAAFHARAGKRAVKIRHWVERRGFVSMIIAAMLPPPLPFKIFVLAAGAFRMPVRQFIVALLIARAGRFYGEGYLAVRYGEQAVQFMIQHKVEVTAALLAAILVLYFLVRLIFRQAPEQHA